MTANWQIECKDVLEWCKEYTGPKFHSLLADPPYSLHFMNKKWDDDIAFRSETWAALSEHLLPGAFGMAFASSRGWHRLACAIEDAGLRIHPSIFCWAQGQGFCKATNIHLQLEKRLCYQDESKDWFYKDDNKPIRTKLPFRHPSADRFYGHRYGGQALAPKVEPIIVFQKPYSGRPVDSIVETGAGALFIDGGRVGASGELGRSSGGWNGPYVNHPPGDYNSIGKVPSGRWPPNFALCHVPPHICADCNGDGCAACDGTGLVGGCRRVGTKRVKGGASEDRLRTTEHAGGHGKTMGTGWDSVIVERGYADADGYEETEAWQCCEECAARRIGEQSEVSGSNKRKCKGHGDAVGLYGLSSKCNSAGVDDTGTCARFFPQFGWTAEVAEHLAAQGALDEAQEIRSLSVLSAHEEEARVGSGDDIDYGTDSGTMAMRGRTANTWPETIAERLAAADQVQYCSKSSRTERNAGLEDLPLQERQTQGRDVVHKIDRRDGKGLVSVNGQIRPVQNPHPTLKPIALCHWLATLLLPPPEYVPRRILIPFAGVMSEAIAAMLAGWEEIVAIEMSEEYCAIGEARLQFWSQFNSYEEAMEAARNIQRSQRKQDAQVKNGQLKLTL